MSMKYKPLGLFLILFVSTVLASSTFGGIFEVYVDNNVHAAVGTTISVPVRAATGLGSFYGFDLLIVYDSSVLSYVGSTPGKLFEIPGDYEWEYLEAGPDTSVSQSGLIRAVGVADIADGEHHPLSYNIPPEGEYWVVLFTLEFTVIADPSYEFTENPIRFYWLDCGDNAIAPDSLGDSLALSNIVSDWVDGGADLTDFTYGLPGIHGAPDSCLTAPTVNREINFFNGGVTILPADTSNIRGDINCNGIPYEIADFTLFTNYFIHGPIAFGDHYICSRVASDINGDGLELTVADLVYVYRVIIGDALPNPAAAKSGVIAAFTQDGGAGTISFDYPNSLAAIYLVFDGEIVPSLLFSADGINMDYAFNEGKTRVLIAPDISASSPTFTTAGGPFLSYTGNALLIEADAADYDGTVFDIHIVNSGGSLGTPFGFEIGVAQDAVPGEDISLPIIKTVGSEKMSGFDILLGYDYSDLSIIGVNPGSIFDIPGDYEWEYFAYRFGPFECSGECPSGMARIIGVAETNNGPNHPSDLPIADGTALFTLDCRVASDPALEGTFIPMNFFWLDCGDNGVAMGTYGDTLALSRYVYDHNGSDITDTTYGFPGYYGVPGSCLVPSLNPPVRMADFKSGGIEVISVDSLQLILSIDHGTAHAGDTAVYLDVHMSNPQDSVAGFVLSINMDNPDLAEFGISPSDTLAVETASTLIADWDYIASQSISGQYHDLKIVALSNSVPPYTAAIPPQQNGVLVRLVLHAYDSIPGVVTDSTTELIISDLVSNTNFSDPDGNTIGLGDGGYDPQKVSFLSGSLTILGGSYGDANGDGVVNIGDAVYLIHYIFKNGPAPTPMEAGDTDCDGAINVSDVVFLINFIFKGGPEPSCP